MSNDLPYDFAGQIVLVSGGTSGIGAATARAFARAGATVAIAGRNEARGDSVVRDCLALGGKAQFFAVDLARAGEGRRMVAGVYETYGRVDIAFNNAAYQEARGLLAEQSDAVFAQVFDTNVRALFEAMTAEIQVMTQQGGGVIVNDASVSGVRNSNPGFALYSASKAAVLSLTRAAAMEYAAAKIRINAVSPGRIATPMMASTKIDLAAVAAGLPLQRLGAPEEVAAAVLWLASPESSFVVGHSLSVDGGFLAR